MTRYFAKKFAPAPPLVVLGSSYKSSPECKPEQPLYDNWLDQSHPHIMGPALYSHRKLLLVGLSQWLVNRQTFRHTTLQTGNKASSMCPPCQILSLPPACHRMGLCKACAHSISPAGSLLQWRPRARLSALMELWSPWRRKVDAAWPAWMQQSVERLEKVGEFHHRPLGPGVCDHVGGAYRPHVRS